MPDNKNKDLHFNSRTIAIGKLLADDLVNEFTQEESDKFIKSLILYHNPQDLDDYLSKIKNSVQSLFEKLVVSIVNYQIENNQFVIPERKNDSEKIKKKFSIQEVQLLMNISRPTIYSWFDKGLKQIKVGGRVFIDENDLNEFLERNRP